jgi:hypothetical protein
LLKFSKSKLVESQQAPWLLLDMLMIMLLMINLVWLIFDWLYPTGLMQQILNFISPAIVPTYAPVHANFAFIDLIFIGIFLSEFCLRWGVSVYHKEHLRWYFYPFIHWYDLVGCIPASSARIFRFLRVFSILYRLHRYQIIDLGDTALFRFVKFYANVVIEELSDRIVAKVLSDAQKDIEAGSPLVQDIMQKVLSSRQQIVFNWAASMANHVGQTLDSPTKGRVLREHIAASVGKAVNENTQVGTFTWMPIVGTGAGKMLEQAVTDIVIQSVVNLLSDINAQQLSDFSHQGIADFNAQEQAIDQEMLQVINECLELVKQHISTQRWKVELQEREEKRG